MIQENRRHTEANKVSEGIGDAIIMHEALQMHLGDYVSFDKKVSSNSVYANSLALVKKMVSPKTRTGNYDQFVLREEINRVSESYSVSTDIINDNKVALRSPEYLKRYIVQEGVNVSDMASLSESLNITKFCHEEVYKNFWEAPNNIVVIWYNEKRESSFYIVDISNVIKLKKEGQEITELTFNAGKSTKIVINKESRTVITSEKGNDKKVTENHNLGYCPAIQISNIKFGNGNGVTSPFYSKINILNQLWFWSNTGETSSTLAAHPSYWYLKADKTPDKNNPYSENTQFDDIGLTTTKVENNSSSSKSDLSIGSPNVMAVGADADGKLIQPIDRLDADVPSLEFLEKKPMTLSQKLSVSLSGMIDPTVKLQINEKQVAAIKEARNGLLNSTARIIERVNIFIEKTVQKEQFGNDVNVALSYGNKFDILNKSNLLEDVEKSKGSKELQKKAIIDVIDFETRGNESLQKNEFVKHLITPYYLRDQTLLDKWLYDGSITYQDWYLGTNLDNLISKYENYVGLISNLESNGTSMEVVVKSVKKYLVEKLIPKQKPQIKDE